MTMIDDFCSIVNSKTTEVNLHKLSCGTNCYFWGAVEEAVRGTEQPQHEDFFNALETLQVKISIIAENRRDPTLIARLRAFVAVIHALAEGTNQKQAFKNAAIAFEETLVEPKPVVVADAVEALDNDLVMKKYGANLPLDTVGGWMVFDMLWHIQHSRRGIPGSVGTGNLLAREETLILIDAGSGRVLRLVAELLDGPPGLTAPDWWPLGLSIFPMPRSPSDDTDFIASTQGLFLACAQRQSPYRFRWRLEPRLPHMHGWNFSIAGRSAEAAVVCVAAAVHDRREFPDYPILNSAMSITATVEGDDPDVTRRKLGAVNPNTIKHKFDAAADAGIGEVLVAHGQTPADLPSPVVQLEAEPTQPRPERKLASQRITTVGDAIMEMSAVNEFVRAYQAHVYHTFTSTWIIEETPRDPAAKTE